MEGRRSARQRGRRTGTEKRQPPTPRNSRQRGQQTPKRTTRDEAGPKAQAADDNGAPQEQAPATGSGKATTRPPGPNGRPPRAKNQEPADDQRDTRTTRHPRTETPTPEPPPSDDHRPQRGARAMPRSPVGVRPSGRRACAWSDERRHNGRSRGGEAEGSEGAEDGGAPGWFPALAGAPADRPDVSVLPAARAFRGARRGPGEAEVDVAGGSGGGPAGRVDCAAASCRLRSPRPSWCQIRAIQVRLGSPARDLTGAHPPARPSSGRPSWRAQSTSPASDRRPSPLRSRTTVEKVAGRFPRWRGEARRRPTTGRR